MSLNSLFIAGLFGASLALSPMTALAGDPPPLPGGLAPAKKEKTEEPGLPTGLGGLDMPAATANTKASDEGLSIEHSGFIELRAGARLQDDPTQKDLSIGEARLQLDLSHEGDVASFNLVTDLLLDGVASGEGIDLETGRGAIDLREANALFRIGEVADLKVGRQVLTWGTGDLLFINDLFPKDWNSFFIGRDDEYLKAPSDAVKLALFGEAINLDIVYTPRFDPDRFIDGSRLSYYNPMLGRIAGRDAVADPILPDEWFDDHETAVRAYRNFGPLEAAAYFYSGFWKSPQGYDVALSRPSFPELTVYGASLRGPAAGGILSAEIGFYNSGQDETGADPFVPNSEFRTLVGFEKEVAPELTLNLQYYVESMQDYDAYRLSLPLGMPVRDENRHLITARLTKFMMNQTLTLSLFNYYSPSDEDGHVRALASYKVTDDWLIDGGVNWFYGEQGSSFFGQFESNSNIYVGVRRSF